MRKIISIVLSFGLLFEQSGLLYAVGEINLANYLSQARSAIVQPDVFQPARLRYISYDVKNNDFKMLLDKGDVGNGLKPFPTQQEVSPQGAVPEKDELFNYFLIGLALPNDTFWVNLRPDAPENIIDPLLEKTDIGKIFLEADLQLKKDTASLTSPQNPEGKAYWDKLYKKAGELFGTENITIPTITRPWIVPNEVIVRETEDSAYIYKATLKVMLEDDYISRGGFEPAPTAAQQYGFSDPRLKELNQYSTQLIRETIIPKLTKEINSSKRYAKLRQVYYSLVLSRWFKQKYQGLPVGNGLKPFPTLDSGDLTNLTSQEPCDKQAYFQDYLKSFKDGEYNLKETVATPFGQSIRSYVSGGITAEMDIVKFHVGANSKKVDDVLTSGSPILSLWGLFNKKKETKNPINILYYGYRKSKDRDEPDVVADRMLNVIFHFNGEIDKKDIQKIIELLERAEKVKPYFYEPILATFNEAVTNWDYESSIVEVRKKIRIALDAFVIDKGGEIIRFINDFLSRNKNKEDGFVQELQEFNNKKERSYDYYVAIANLLHHKRHHLERASEFHKGIAGRKLHNFMTEVSLLRGFDVKKYDEIVLSELTKISPIVDDVIIVDFILNYSKLFASGSPLNAEALEAKLVKLPKTENQLSDLIKIFSEVDKNAQLGPQTALLIAEMLTDSMMTPFPGESPNVFLMRGAVMKSVTTFFSNKKLYNLYSKDRFSIIEVLDKIKKGLLLEEKSINIPGRKISEETKKDISALIDLYIKGVDNAKNDIEKQGEAFAGSPLEILTEKFKAKGFGYGSLNAHVKFKEYYKQLDVDKPIELDGIVYNPNIEMINTIDNANNRYAQISVFSKDKSVPYHRIIIRGYQKSGSVVTYLDVGQDYERQDNEEKLPTDKENLKERLEGVAFNDYDNFADAIMTAINKAKPKSIQKVSGALPAKGVSSSLQTKRGGIDLTDRMLNMRIERVGSFASSALVLPEINNLEALDLDKEYERIQAMVSSSIRPSDTRILEFAAACYYRGEFDRRLAQVSSCVKAAHLADEILGRDSSEALRLATMLPDALYGG